MHPILPSVLVFVCFFFFLKGRGNRSLSGTQECMTCNPGKIYYLQRVWKMPSPLCLVSKTDNKETRFVLVILEISFLIKCVATRKLNESSLLTCS